MAAFFGMQPFFLHHCQANPLSRGFNEGYQQASPIWYILCILAAESTSHEK
jgi:hypothetical protein